MVKINKIYTRVGDKGTTHLVGGIETNKDSIRVEAYGEVDELNAHLGNVRTISDRLKMDFGEKIEAIQNELFDLGAVLATSPDKLNPAQQSITPELIQRMESWIDELVKELPELRSFVIPGGSEINSALHIARTVCRRAERGVWSLSRVEMVPDNIPIYLNRLSDLLFAMARYSSHVLGIPEYLWKPR